MKSTFLWVFLLGLLSSCQTEEKNDTYYSEIEQWQKDRLASLTRSDGWTTLIGLHWLDQGVNSFGSSESNKIVFPEMAPAHMGTFNLSGDSVSVQINDSVDVLIDGMVDKFHILNSDLQDHTTFMNWKSLSWYVIKREDQFGIRIKDSLAQQRFALTEIPHYPIDKNWKIKASFIPPDSGAIIKIENILGQLSDNSLEGQLEFTYKGKNYQLAALNGGPDAYFIIIADETTGEDTYGGGRYIYVDKADSTGVTYIDFNKAYNPPCVFSEYATCPLPPRENYLPFSVLAGEKELPHHVQK